MQGRMARYKAVSTNGHEFQRVSHAGPICVPQKLIAEIETGFKQKHPQARRPNITYERFHLPDKVERFQPITDKRRWQEAIKFPRHIDGAP
jgi:hypothetical protein